MSEEGWNKFFAIERVSEHITRIRDTTKTACYLVEGTERACLVDTGVGVGNLRECIESLTGLPYFVLLTHGHVDHVGGVGCFADKDVFLNQDDLGLAAKHSTAEIRLGYLAHCESRLGKQLPKEPLAPAYDFANTKPLHDGDLFDLGGLALEAIHVPGHTQGMCMVLMREERTILFGDACGESVLLVEDYCSTVKEYGEALKRVKARENEYDFVLRNHGTCESDKAILDELIHLCDLILAGQDDAAPAEGIAMDAPEARFAKARDSKTHKRLDGGHGNIAYLPSRIL